VDLSLSNRITLIKRIGEAMQNETLADLDLTLDTFGIPNAPTPQGYGDEQYEYVLQRMKQAPDEVVVGVHAHLYPDAQAEIGSAAVEPQPDGPWADETFRLFLSHTDENKVLAGQIRTRLADYGIDAYVAHDNIKPTSEWQNDIEAALKTCDALAAILTPDFLHSKWCDQEVGTVFGRYRCIIGIKQGALPHGFIAKYQAIGGDASDFAAWVIAERIVSALWINAQTRPRMTRPAVVAYAQSNSFANARSNYARSLELRADEWTDELVSMAENAARENRQVKEAVLFSEDGDNDKLLPGLLVRHLDKLLDRPSIPAEMSDFESVAARSTEDDIPF
jgi:hypothetical protein